MTQFSLLEARLERICWRKRISNELEFIEYPEKNYKQLEEQQDQLLIKR